MIIIIAVISILVFTLLVWIVNKKLSINICPICAGVTLTWVWMFAGMWFGLLSATRYEFITAILMGASIGGIVTEIKKKFAGFKNRNEEENKKVELLKNKMKDCC